MRAPFSEGEIDFCEHFKRWRLARVYVCMNVCTCRCRSFSPLHCDIPRFQHRQNDKALPWILIFARRIVKCLVVRLFKLSLRRERRRIVVFLLQLYNIPQGAGGKYCFKKISYGLIFLRRFPFYSFLGFREISLTMGSFCDFMASVINFHLFTVFFCFSCSGEKDEILFWWWASSCYPKKD